MTSMLLPLASFAATLASAQAGPLRADEVVAAFQEVCLNTRGKGFDAVIAAILARPGVSEQPGLPAYGGGKPMRLFKDAGLEYLARPGRGGRYGCFVAVNADQALASSIKTGVDSLGGWQGKAVKPGKKIYFEWTAAGSKDEIRLTPQSDIGAILLNLEVNS